MHSLVFDVEGGYDSKIEECLDCLLRCDRLLVLPLPVDGLACRPISALSLLPAWKLSLPSPMPEFLPFLPPLHSLDCPPSTLPAAKVGGKTRGQSRAGRKSQGQAKAIEAKQSIAVLSTRTSRASTSSSIGGGLHCIVVRLILAYLLCCYPSTRTRQLTKVCIRANKDSEGAQTGD